MLEVIGFFIGVQLSISLFAALYRVIDLWYCFDSQWLSVLKGIVLNTAILFLLYAFTADAFTNGLLVGQIFFTLYHVVIFWIVQYLVASPR